MTRTLPMWDDLTKERLTAGAARQAAEHILRTAGDAEAAGKARLWLASVLAVPALEMPLHTQDVLDPEARRRFEEGLRRLAAAEPFDYVVGVTEFMGHRLRCDRRALIPRPETEQLVEHVLADPSWRHAPAVVVDVGTGSGCIALSLALARPEAVVHAVDTEAPALELARENLAAHDLLDRVTLHRADLLTPFAAETVDCVVSNPPYVSDSEHAALASGVRDFEPKSALAAGPEGLDRFRELVPQAATVLKPGGRLWLEIGAEQGAAVRGLLEAAGLSGVTVHQDLAGRDRIVDAIRT